LFLFGGPVGKGLDSGGVAMSRGLAIVFGGSRGIGAACVDALLREGFQVAWTYVSHSAAAVAAAGAHAYQADVRDASQVANVFEQAKRDFGAAPNCVVMRSDERRA